MYVIKLLTLLVLFFSILNGKDLEKVSIKLDWLHQFQFAGYYMAKEKGFYKEENLDVDIEEYKFNNDVVKDVLTGKYTYGVGKSSLIIDRLEDKEVILLNAIYQTSPMVLITRKDSNITNPSELKNKKVMLTADARSAASINSMIISQGLKLDDIKFQKHSFNLDDLIDGKTDAMGCYLSNEPFLLEKLGVKYNILNPSDYGFNFYGGIFFTSQVEFNTNPRRVRSIYKATLKGWAYAFNNIEETAKTIYEKYNTQQKSLESLIYEGQILKKLSKIDEGLLGNIDAEKINEIKRLYVLLGFGHKQKRVPDAKEFIYDNSSFMYSQDQKEYVDHAKINLLTNNTYPPFTIMKNNELHGIEIDYWKLIVEKLKLKNSSIEIVNDSKVAIEKIKNNPNLVRYAFSERDTSNKTILTDTIIDIKIGIASLMERPYLSDLNQLNDKKVAIVKHASYLNKLENNYPKVDFIKVSSTDEALKLLKEKKVYAIVNKMPFLNYTISHNALNEVKIIGSFDEKYALKLVVNSENPKLLNLINDAISSISDKDKEIISSKYYSVVFQDSEDYKELYKVIIPLIILIIFMTRSNRIMNKEIKRRKEIEVQLNKVANIDSLTNIYNRRKMNTLFENEINRVKRYKRDLSIIFFDIDNFKLINDQLGHHVGDEVLIKISGIVKSNIRKTDYFGRWGGEEFILILPETNKEKASNIAYILKEKISQYDFNIDRNITCSFGVTQFEETDNEDSILTRVDHAMYYVKEHGKNDIKVV